jgi:hypothetical protein
MHQRSETARPGVLRKQRLALMAMGEVTMARGMVVLVVVLRAGRPVALRPSARSPPCRGRGVPASPRQRMAEWTDAAEQAR